MRVFESNRHIRCRNSPFVWCKCRTGDFVLRWIQIFRNNSDCIAFIKSINPCNDFWSGGRCCQRFIEYLIQVFHSLIINLSLILPTMISFQKPFHTCFPLYKKHSASLHSSGNKSAILFRDLDMYSLLLIFVLGWFFSSKSSNSTTALYSSGSLYLKYWKK